MHTVSGILSRLAHERSVQIVRADVIMDKLSDADWQELALLIEEAPVGRIHAAMSRVDPSVVSIATASAVRLVTWFDRLVHLATISSGSSFDRALLRELRRLNVH